MSFPANVQEDDTGVDGQTDYLVTVEIVNSGETSGDRSIELKRNSTVVDSASISLGVNQTTTTTLIDSDVPTAEAGNVVRYSVDTGNRVPEIDTKLLRRFLVDGTLSEPTVIPDNEVGRIELFIDGVLRIDDTDQLELH